MMQEFVRKSDVQALLSVPSDILSEQIDNLKGVCMSIERKSSRMFGLIQIII